MIDILNEILTDYFKVEQNLQKSVGLLQKSQDLLKKFNEEKSVNLP